MSDSDTELSVFSNSYGFENVSFLKKLSLVWCGYFQPSVYNIYLINKVNK